MQVSCTHHTVELAPFVPLRLAQTTLCLAGAELAEILGCLGHDIFEKLYFDAAKRLAWCMASVS